MSKKPFAFEKDPIDTWDVLISYLNSDSAIQYTIQSMQVKAYNKAGDDVTTEIVDEDKTEFAGNQAIVWVKGGENKQVYKIEATAHMQTGQEITKKLIMTVLD